MSQHVTVVLTDDLDGSEATETVRFALDGTWYEIDLNPGNAEKLREVVREWISHARKAGTTGSGTGAARSGAGSRPVSRGDRERRPADPRNAAIREWARSEGIEMGGHGRIPAHVRAMYEVRTGEVEGERSGAGD